eukprot:Gb_29972 [translate_table: standard]
MAMAITASSVLGKTLLSSTKHHNFLSSPIQWKARRSLNTILNGPQVCRASLPGGRKLVLYSKTGCCLCDGLKEKLQMAFMIGGKESLADVQLEVRDITTNPDWEKAYQYEIPVLARILNDGSEETLPRMSPRLSVEQVHKKLAAVLI